MLCLLICDHRWSLIAGRLPGRTDNEIKNYWNTNLGKGVKSTSSLMLHAPPPDAKTTENPKPQLTPKVKVTPSPSTKATKCSTVLFKNSLPHSSSMQMLQNKSKAEDVVSNNSISNPMEPNDDNNGFLSFINEEEKEVISTDLLKDFKEGDICLSELLNSDFSNMCDFSYNDDNEELLSPCSDQLPVFSDEILRDWTQSNFASDETNVPNNLCSFS